MLQGRHHLGSFHESVTVNAITYSFREYSKLPHDERQELREVVVKRVSEANSRYSMACQKVADPIREEYKLKRETYLTLPCFQRRRKGRADEIRYGLDRLRREERAACESAYKTIRKPEGNCNPAAVYDIFKVWEEKIETPQERLERLLKDFDWYFEYSDDFRVWSAGDAQLHQIRDLVDQLGSEGERLYGKYAPKAK